MEGHCSAFGSAIIDGEHMDREESESDTGNSGGWRRKLSDWLGSLVPRGLVEIAPVRRKQPWTHKSDYAVINMTLFFIWFLRIFSPGTWLGAIFSYKADSGRYYSRHGTTEMYVFLVLILSSAVLILPLKWLAGLPITVVWLVLVVEFVIHNFWIMIVRPSVEDSYIQYSALRTNLLTIIGIITINNLYSCMYYYNLQNAFQGGISRIEAWAFSLGEITGSAFGPIKPLRSDHLTLVSASEKVVGVFLVVIFISIMLGRLGTREIGSGLAEQGYPGARRSE